MRIAVDAIGYSAGKGASRDLENLLRALPEAAPNYDLILLGTAADLRGLCEGTPWGCEDVPGSSRFARTRWGLTRAALKARADVLYVNGEIGPASDRVPYVMHVHEDFTRRYRIHLWTGSAPPGGWMRGTAWQAVATVQFRHSATRAAKVVASSKATAADLVRRFRLPESKIRVVYLGVDHVGTDGGRRAPRSGYLFHLSSDDPRDNTWTVVDAYVAARRGRPAFPPLVIGGRLSASADPLRRRILELGLERCVSLVGYLDSEALVSCIEGSLACVQPSLFEGFGYKPLEQMMLGKPVIAGDTPEAREILGDGALLVGAASVIELASAMRLLASDPQRRSELASAGADRARRLRWSDTARALVDLFEKVAATGSAGGTEAGGA